MYQKKTALSLILVLMSFVCIWAGESFAKDCSKHITAWFGLGNCDDYVAVHLKNASNIKTGGLSYSQYQSATLRMTKFRNKVLLPTFPNSNIGFDALVDLLHDLNTTGLATGLCQEAEKILTEHNYTCAELYQSFARKFLAYDGEAYYAMKNEIIKKQQKAASVKKAQDELWNKSIQQSNSLKW